MELSMPQVLIYMPALKKLLLLKPVKLSLLVLVLQWRFLKVMPV